MRLTTARKRETMEMRRKTGYILLLALLLAALLGACGASARGRTVAYDGFTVRTEKTREAPAGTDAPTRSAAPPSTEEAPEADYVLNTSSKKFHLPDCSGAAAIKEKNRWDYRGTRDSVLEMGYQPCKICNP